MILKTSAPLGARKCVRSMENIVRECDFVCVREGKKDTERETERERERERQRDRDTEREGERL